ncbi:hypothetical protein Krad_4611 (plasmid) [Kineococcus radiotolerans SRS30216 = ATCC BAA-149]|uniref:Uncharacterized protein n=1 Tax=Kineococcus radiotolerans (strain ATCC BAA-149 / DSM 14245 / SRS30216) TaxID=266940 RepID=A6WGY1_KINRD|nr:hypothetical protein Krad_4611 [Kineococcus radiotolerans SRS30216 = ATCC BAA-149]
MPQHLVISASLNGATNALPPRGTNPAQSGHPHKDGPLEAVHLNSHGRDEDRPADLESVGTERAVFTDPRRPGGAQGVVIQPPTHPHRGPYGRVHLPAWLSALPAPSLIALRTTSPTLTATAAGASTRTASTPTTATSRPTGVPR